MNPLHVIILITALGWGLSPAAHAADPLKAPQVLARHFTALGGQTNVARIETMLLRATKEGAQGNASYEIRFKLPGKLLFDIKQNGAVTRQSRDGRARYWCQDAAGIRELTGAAVNEMLGLATGLFPPGQLFWNDMLADATCKEERLSDREVVVVGRKNSRFPLLFFDKGSEVLVKAGDYEFGDYRVVEGIKVPFLAVSGDKARFRVHEVLLNPPLADAVFERPDRRQQTGREPRPVITFGTLLSKPGEMETVRSPAPLNITRGELASLPKYDPKAGRHWQVDVRAFDLRKLDLTGRLNDLLHADFDGRTCWPDQLPAGFDREHIQQLGRNPGLRVRQLHQRGVTGKGIGLGIIDQTLLVDHAEYRDRLRLYEEIHIPANEPAQMHGPAVASIAVGKTVGVAPEADLYYVAETHGDHGADGEFEWDFTWLAKSIHRLLDVNASLPGERKLRVISISVGWSRHQKGYAETVAAVERATKDGVFIVSTALEETRHLAFHGLGREALSDPDDVNSYGPGSWWGMFFWGGQQRFEPGRRLLVPMDARCTASPAGANEYVFYSSGGWSWSVPWIAGLYTLCCQVKRDITPEQFWAAALRTGRTIQLQNDNETVGFGTIADPVALISSLEHAQRAK